MSERLTTQPDLLELISALTNKRVTNARAELEVVIRMLYRLLNITISARYILETCVLWAIHMHWDPHPEPHNQEEVENTLVHLLSRSLLT